MQCNAKYKIYCRDKDSKKEHLLITLFCTKDKDHEDDHGQQLTWNKPEHNEVLTF